MPHVSKFGECDVALQDLARSVKVRARFGSDGVSVVLEPFAMTLAERMLDPVESQRRILGLAGTFLGASLVEATRKAQAARFEAAAARLFRDNAEFGFFTEPVRLELLAAARGLPPEAEAVVCNGFDAWQRSRKSFAVEAAPCLNRTLAAVRASAPDRIAVEDEDERWLSRALADVTYHAAGVTVHLAAVPGVEVAAESLAGALPRLRTRAAEVLATQAAEAERNAQRARDEAEATRLALGLGLG